MVFHNSLRKCALSCLGQDLVHGFFMFLSKLTICIVNVMEMISVANAPKSKIQTSFYKQMKASLKIFNYNDKDLCEN